MNHADAHPQPSQALPGLTTPQAAERLARDGPNESPAEIRHPLLEFAKHLRGPVPWMLEATILLEGVLRRPGAAGIIAILLVFNAGVSWLQEHRAQNALALLRKRLQIQARVLRDGHWRVVPARELVVADVVHLRLGDVAPADVALQSGQVLLDQSALTGESLPVEAGAGKIAYAATVVRRGEATGVVTATGTRTAFGKTAELVRMAKTRSHLESVVFSLVKYLVLLDVVLVLIVLAYATATGLPLREVLPFSLMLLVASVPVALPATFTVATALGATELVREGILVTRLAAIEEAAGMDVLCSDKTGTITKNQLTVSGLVAFSPFTDQQLLEFATAASDEATQDPLDLAILDKARTMGACMTVETGRQFIPFDPATKRSEAILSNQGTSRRVVKGAPTAVMMLAGGPNADITAQVERLAASGARVLAVAMGPSGANQTLAPVGLIGLSDPPRPDSAELISHLRDMGIRVVMVTGDGVGTAAAVAQEVGIGRRVCMIERLRENNADDVLDYDVFAGVLPEDKFRLVQAFQRHGHATGMTGDGVNDAPALKQAEVGIAVSNATDVAKAAASLVLTNPGLSNVLAAVQSSRRIYQRMVTYTLNKIIKTCAIALLLSVGLLLTGQFLMTPTLIVLLLFTNDFVTMSIATDRVTSPRSPTRWRVGSLTYIGLTLGALLLVLLFGVFFLARDVLGLPLKQIQTLMFVLMVFGNQATVYLVREHQHFWHSMPSRWLLASSIADVLAVSLLAIYGILMAPIHPWLLAMSLALTAIFLVVVDLIKVRLRRAL